MAKLSTTLKKKLVTAYNEAEELNTSLSTLTDDEIIEVKETLIMRTIKIMKSLDKYITEEDLIDL